VITIWGESYREFMGGTATDDRIKTIIQTWACRFCKATNYMSMLDCHSCGAPRP
jgi:hypothetical protein